MTAKKEILEHSAGRRTDRTAPVVSDFAEALSEAVWRERHSGSQSAALRLFYLSSDTDRRCCFLGGGAGTFCAGVSLPDRTAQCLRAAGPQNAGVGEGRIHKCVEAGVEALHAPRPDSRRAVVGAGLRGVYGDRGGRRYVCGISSDDAACGVFPDRAYPVRLSADRHAGAALWHTTEKRGASDFRRNCAPSLPSWCGSECFWFP